jgi:hypothetical protein
MLCLVLCVSLVLAPMGRVHAHVSSKEHGLISVHGGNDHAWTYHDHDHVVIADALVGDHAAHHHEAGCHTIDLSPDALKPNLVDAKSVSATAMLCVAMLLLPAFADTDTILKPLRTRIQPPSPYPHALPQLRGPPRSI